MKIAKPPKIGMRMTPDGENIVAEDKQYSPIPDGRKIVPRETPISRPSKARRNRDAQATRTGEDLSRVADEVLAATNSPPAKKAVRPERAVKQALERHGVTLDAMAAKLAEGLEAVHCWRQINRRTGDVATEIEPDYIARHKYVETAAKLLRAIPTEHESRQEASILILNLPTQAPSVQDWNKSVGAVSVRVSQRGARAARHEREELSDVSDSYGAASD